MEQKERILRVRGKAARNASCLMDQGPGGPGEILAVREQLLSKRSNRSRQSRMRNGVPQLFGPAIKRSAPWAHRQEIRSPRQRQLGPASTFLAARVRDASAGDGLIFAPFRSFSATNHSRPRRNTPTPPSPADGNLRQVTPPRLTRPESRKIRTRRLSTTRLRNKFLRKLFAGRITPSG